MAIEITGLPTPPPQAAPDKSAGAAEQRPAAVAGQEESGRSASDTLNLTDTAAQLRRLEKHLATLPSDSTQRVESIRQAVTSGTYQVNPARIADKLLGFEVALHAAAGPAKP